MIKHLLSIVIIYEDNTSSRYNKHKFISFRNIILAVVSTIEFLLQYTEIICLRYGRKRKSILYYTRHKISRKIFSRYIEFYNIPKKRLSIYLDKNAKFLHSFLLLSSLKLFGIYHNVKM
jgi:hypothetical protein